MLLFYFLDVVIFFAGGNCSGAEAIRTESGFVRVPAGVVVLKNTDNERPSVNRLNITHVLFRQGFVTNGCTMRRKSWRHDAFTTKCLLAALRVVHRWEGNASQAWLPVSSTNANVQIERRRTSVVGVIDIPPNWFTELYRGTLRRYPNIGALV